ncbi:MAG: sugar phosphate nucleotidyltransferase, partial [Proteobacteria bacterium]|nr:sugar phosphate nucleotidyltransferase [Pseudomonadota bacterium]
MKVMILAAGRGERMGELTRDVPKPMLSLLGEPLIGHQLQKIAVMGFTDVVINVSYLGDQIQNYCGDGSRFGLSIQYSYEQNRLETAGGIIQALPMLGDAPFWVI